MTTGEVIDVGNKLFYKAMDACARNGYVNTGNIATVIAVMFKLAFAFEEKGYGLENARKVFQNPLDYMMDVMIDGAFWDLVKECWKYGMMEELISVRKIIK